MGGMGISKKKHVDGYPLNTVEVYTPESNVWELVPKWKLLNPRAYFKIGKIENKLYAVGGTSNNRNSSSKSVDEFDITTESWKHLPPMKRPRRSAGKPCNLKSIFVFILLRSSDL